MIVTIEPRYRGPATSGNGGYTAGTVATASGLMSPEGGQGGRSPEGGQGGRSPEGDRGGWSPEGDRGGWSAEGDRGSWSPAAAVSVRLRTPPPLDRPMSLEPSGEGWTLRDGDVVVAESSPGALDVDPVPPVPYEQAVDAARSYGGFARHPFPGCFVCGPERSVGEGLRLFPGRTGPGRTACAWTPDESAVIDGRVPAAMVWAALDCPGGWTAEIEGRPMVLGTMTAAVGRSPEPGENCVVVGALLGIERRRAQTATTVYGADGEVLGVASAVWVEIDADAFNRVFAPVG
jgi:hypothetical protein